MMEETTGKTTIPELARELLNLPFAQIVPSDTNPRLNLEREPFEELKKSIFANGLLQPIVVRPKGDVYEIIGGHRRFHALKELAAEHPSDKRFTRVAVVVVDVDDSMVPVLQLAENINRRDLSPMEVAEAVARAVKSGVDPGQLATNLGWTRRSLNRYIQLANAPDWFREYAKEVKVTKKKVDADGVVVMDAKTNKPAVTVERFTGLQFTELSELLTLYGILRDHDAIMLEEAGGEGFKPQAERTTRRLACACAAEGWSKVRLRDEIARVKDPKPKGAAASGGSSGSNADAEAPTAIVIRDNKCVIDMKRAAALSASERGELAAALTRALAPLRFKNVVITA